LRLRRQACCGPAWRNPYDPRSEFDPKGKPVPASEEPVLLSGGNPQIAKADGDAPVQAYIAAMPGWKSDVGRLLDSIIVDSVPHVQKAVRWNSPFYGIKGQGWFVSFHCFAKYVKVTFFNGRSLRPPPPVESKHDDVRYLHVSEEEPLDRIQFADWTKQASALPGEQLF
jgi:hypothetical protein